MRGQHPWARRMARRYGATIVRPPPRVRTANYMPIIPSTVPQGMGVHRGVRDRLKTHQRSAAELKRIIERIKTAREHAGLIDKQSAAIAHAGALGMSVPRSRHAFSEVWAYYRGAQYESRGEWRVSHGNVLRRIYRDTMRSLRWLADRSLDPKVPDIRDLKAVILGAKDASRILGRPYRYDAWDSPKRARAREDAYYRGGKIVIPAPAYFEGKRLMEKIFVYMSCQ